MEKVVKEEGEEEDVAEPSVAGVTRRMMILPSKGTEGLLTDRLSGVLMQNTSNENRKKKERTKERKKEEKEEKPQCAIIKDLIEMCGFCSDQRFSLLNLYYIWKAISK